MIGDAEVGIVGENDTHKYVGRYLSGVFKNRDNVENSHCIQCVWHKNVSVKLKLKLFDATESPSLLFGLSTSPILQSNMDKKLVCQRKVLRKILGWVRHPGDE